MSRSEVRDRLRASAERAARAALAAVEPGARVHEALARAELRGPCRVLALGKAAEAMTRAALAELGDEVVGGVAVLPSAGASPDAIGPVACLAGAHPIPDERSAAAGERLLEEAAELAGNETALVLLSGGASALAATPIDGTSVAELAELHEARLRSGAPIAEINAERGPRSRVHAGGLSRAIGAHPALTLAISDVPGDVPADIGSGPMHEKAPAGERRFEIVASGALAARAAAESLRADGLLVSVDEQELRGDAEAEACLRSLRAAALGSGTRALVCHGEPTVQVAGPSRGGRCTQAALAAADWFARWSDSPTELGGLFFASDGRDGSSGSSGAWVDRLALERARARGLDARASLDARDTASLLGAVDALLPEEPTGTNVADLWILLRDDVDDRLVCLEERGGLELAPRPEARSPALLVRGSLRRALLPAGGRLRVLRAWEPGDGLREDGLCVELAGGGEGLAARGLSEEPARPGCWRKAGPSRRIGPFGELD